VLPTLFLLFFIICCIISSTAQQFRNATKTKSYNGQTFWCWGFFFVSFYNSIVTQKYWPKVWRWKSYYYNMVLICALPSICRTKKMIWFLLIWRFLLIICYNTSFLVLFTRDSVTFSELYGFANNFEEYMGKV
jgi:hypothetical protein